MPWQLIIAPRAEKDLAGLPQRARAAIAQVLDHVATDPGSTDLRKLVGRQHRWRLRVGRFRAILRFDSDAGQIHVLRVLPRGRAYRD